MEQINAIGRRKTAVARLYLNQGKGNITINNREFTEYFPTSELQNIAKFPLVLLNATGNFDIKVTIEGGGIKGQSEAFRLAIARALVKLNPEDRKLLKANHLLTRDPRKVERKKPGQPGARKRFQFSKR